MGDSHHNVLVDLEGEVRESIPGNHIEWAACCRKGNETGEEAAPSKVLLGSVAATNSKTTSTSWSSITGDTSLEAPNHTSIKINCDAAWASASRVDGIRIIARNHVGEIVGGAHR